MSDIDPIDLLVVRDREKEDSAHSKEEMSVVPLPGHDDTRHEIYYTALMVKMGLDATEVVQ